MAIITHTHTPHTHLTHLTLHTQEYTMSGWLDKRGGLEATKVRNFTFHIEKFFHVTIYSAGRKDGVFLVTIF